MMRECRNRMRRTLESIVRLSSTHSMTFAFAYTTRRTCCRGRAQTSLPSERSLHLPNIVPTEAHRRRPSFLPSSHRQVCQQAQPMPKATYVENPASRAAKHTPVRTLCPCEEGGGAGGRLHTAQTKRHHMERQTLKEAREAREARREEAARDEVGRCCEV